MSDEPKQQKPPGAQPPGMRETPDEIYERILDEPINTEPLFLLRDIWPDVVERLKILLMEDGGPELAATVEGLQVYDRCDCGADYCSIVHTKSRTRGEGGPTHRTLNFSQREGTYLGRRGSIGNRRKSPTTKYLTILEVVNEEIVLIEILDDHESRRALITALPDKETTGEDLGGEVIEFYE
jgi:hypothetical protein